MYFNSTDDVMKVYDGASWVAAYASIAGITLNDVTNDGNTTTNTITVGGLTSTGAVILNADPSSNLGAATKQYVDTIAAAGIHYHDPVRVEQEGNLTATYDNGSSGVGATLTNSSTQEALVIDGVTLLSGDRVLIYEQTNQAHNGIYTVTDVGSGSTNWVLTRAIDADSYAPSDPDRFGQGDAFYVQEGLMGAGETYVMTTEGSITFGTTNIHFSQISSAQVYNGSTGIDITGTTISSTATLADVTTAGNSTTNSITVGGITSTGNVTASNLNTNDWDTAYGWGNHASAGYYVNGTTGFASTGIDDNATSTAITIDASGHVGVGTTNPNAAYALDVAGNIRATNSAGSTIIVNRTSNPGSVELQYSGTQTAQFSAVSGGGVATYVGSTPIEAMRVDASGNVTIGSTDAGNAGTLNLSVGLAGTTAGGIQLWSPTNGSHFVQFGDSTGGDGPYRGVVGYNHTNDALLMYTAGTESARIDASGNLTVTGSVTATTFSGSGSGLTSLNAGNISSGTISDARLPDTISSNITGSSASCTGNAATATDCSRIPLATGEYGTIKVNDDRGVTWAGYAIRDNWVFMANGAQDCGIYNDTDNKWATTFVRNGATYLYHNGSSKIETTSGGANITGALNVGGITSTGLVVGTRGAYAFNSHNDVGNFSVRGDTSYGAIMSFHRTGAYAVNFGLDSDNVFKLGGWSASIARHYWDMSGNYTATGNVTAYSDERLKDNIETLDGSKVYEMRGVSFTKDGKAGSGVIAQELQKVAPELVHEGEEYLSVAYGNLVGYLIEAVKELKAEIDELKGAK